MIKKLLATVVAMAALFSTTAFAAPEASMVAGEKTIYIEGSLSNASEVATILLQDGDGNIKYAGECTADAEGKYYAKFDFAGNITGCTLRVREGLKDVTHNVTVAKAVGEPVVYTQTITDSAYSTRITSGEVARMVVDVINKYASSGTVRPYLVYFDSQMRMIDVEMLGDVTIGYDVSTRFEIESDITVPAKTKTIKALLWSADEELVPLANTKETPIDVVPTLPPVGDLQTEMTIHSKNAGDAHTQGLAIDTANNILYVSNTKSLLKIDLDTNEVIGSVYDLEFHLGDLAFNDADGKVYGSGMNYYGRQYVAIFDPAKITGLDTERDTCMTTVFLKEPSEWLMKTDKYSSFGIDGMEFAPAPGDDSGKKYLYIVNGNRPDEGIDYQVMLKYDVTDWAQYERTYVHEYANQHTSGPDKADNIYYVYTGNTDYGVQCMEYDEYSKSMILSVYNGSKEGMPNYGTFFVDLSVLPKVEAIEGTDETGTVLTLAKYGQEHAATGIWGVPVSDLGHGSHGFVSLGNGYYYFLTKDEANYDTTNEVATADTRYEQYALYKWVGGEIPFEKVQ